MSHTKINSRYVKDFKLLEEHIVQKFSTGNISTQGTSENALQCLGLLE